MGDVLEDEDPAHGWCFSLSGKQPTFMKNGAPHSPLVMDGDRAKRALWMAALVVLGFLLRTTNAADVFVGDAVVFPGNDPYYQVHRVFQALDAYPGIPLTDAQLDHPFGAAPIWPPVFPWLLATLAKLTGVSATDPAAVERLLAMIIPLLGALLCVPVYGLARRILDGPGAWLAATFAVLVPAHLWYSRLGFVDHHAAVTLVQASMFLAALVAVRGGSVVGLVCAVAFGMALWNGFILFVGVLDAYLAIQILLERDVSRQRIARLAAIANGVAAVLLVPLVAVTVAATGAPWGTYAVSYLHVVVLAAVAAAATVVAWRPGVAAPGLVAVVVIGLAGGLASGALAEAAGWIFARDDFMSSIQEVVPIFLRSDGTLDLSAPTIWLTRFWLVVPVLLALLVVDMRRQGRVDAGRLLLLVWSSALFLLALRQRRFAESFAPALAILVAFGLRWAQSRMIGALETRGASNGLARGLSATAVLVVFAIGLGPYYGPILRHPTGLLSIAEASAGSNATRELPVSHRNLVHLGVLARKSPGGVMNLWPLGHRVLYLTRLPVAASPFGSHVGGESFDASTDFFLATEESAAVEILDRRQLRYVVVDNDLGTVGAALLARDGSTAEYYAKTRLASGDQQIEYLPPLFETQYGRLALLAGAGLEGTVQPLRHFRLIVDAPEDHHPGNPKIFERVEGAELVLQGTPNASYEVRYEFQSNAGRTRAVAFDARTDPEGVARLTLPYSSERPDLGHVGTWRIPVGNGARGVFVPEAAVLNGTRIEVDLRPSILF